MIPYQLIRRKRDGETLAPEELRALLHAFHEGKVADYQMAAFLMAVFFRGLSADELDAMVDAMIDSGVTVDFSGEPGRRVDKHSTGGVGDKVSLILAPLVAALGVHVPMMSGRGLGHSGGTVDKLESIPGFRLDLGLDALREQVLSVGTAMISQTGEIAPLDKRLYALRDVTATVESIPLIASSIMSKKVAEGIDGLVLDVKVGNGAFMAEEARALELAETMIGIGRSRGCRTVALLTAMDRPLGRAVGNALEVKEALEVLRGGGPSDVREVTVALAAEMLVLGSASADLDEARSEAESALDDGRALATFRRVVDAQGGDTGALDDPDRLASAPVVRPAESSASGVVTGIDTRAVGEAAVSLGAGRRSLEDVIDPAVGFVMRVGPGDRVESGAPLADVHASDEASAERACDQLRAAIRIGAGAAELRPLITHRVSAEGAERLA